MVQLIFAVVGERNAVGVVNVGDDALIYMVKAAIKETQQYSFPATELTLFTTMRSNAVPTAASSWLPASGDDFEALQTMPTPVDIKNKYLDRQYELNPTSRVCKHFAGVPEDEVIHILVCLPERLVEARSRKRSLDAVDEISPSSTRSCVPDDQEVDFTPDWRSRFRMTYLSADELPPVASLAAFVQEDLPEKIPLMSKSLASMRKSINKSLLAKLFVEDDAAPCNQYYAKVVLHAIDPFDIDGRSEAAFISYWDTLIARPLRLTSRGLSFDRNTNRNTSIAMKRPDFVCTLNRVCIFRGEEKDGETDIGEPQEELQSKLIWSYGSAPYLLGYATSGRDCALFALVAADGKSVVSVPLASFKTKDDAEDRLRLLLALLQLSRLFEGIVHRCPDTARDEFRRIVRPNGVIVQLNTKSVEKRFPLEARWSHIRDHLEQVYQVIQSHEVPHTDQLVESKQSDYRFVFTPRGSDMRPQTLDELFMAIGHVLECLAALHEAGWMHRDLRWDNVLKRRDVENQWFVIDFVDAARSPKQNDLELETLNPSNHAPEIFEEGGSHTTSVDVWGVGVLIDTCQLNAVSEKWSAVQARVDFLKELLATNPAQRPSAVEALAELRRLQAA